MIHDECLAQLYMSMKTCLLSEIHEDSTQLTFSGKSVASL